MKIQLLKIMNSIKTLEMLGEQKFSAKVAYRIQRNIRAIQPELECFEDSRRQLIKKYSKDHEEKGTYIPEENLEKVNQEINDILQEEIDINISKIHIDDLSLEMTPNDLMLIDWMLESDDI